MSLLASAALLWVFLAFAFEAVTFKEALGFRKLCFNSSKKKYKKLKESVSLIVPFKGTDIGLEKNIKAILNQNFQYKEAIFAVHSKTDPAYKILKKFENKNVRIIVSNPPKGYAGKIANLHSAVKAATGDILLFADSDTRPSNNWASRMVRPFTDKSVLAATSYRWYFPAKNTFSNLLKSMWNTVGLEIMSNPKLTYIWGGSFAIRKETFDRLKILEKWKGETSDDSVITRELRKGSHKIIFVPDAVVATMDNACFKNFMEFANRQVFFVRTYMKTAWATGLVIYSFSTLVLLSGIASMYYGFKTGGMFYQLAGIMLLLPQLTNYLKAYVRFSALKNILPDYRKLFEKSLNKTILLQFLLKPIVNYNLLRVAFRKKIIWRGIEYKMR